MWLSNQSRLVNITNEHVCRKYLASEYIQGTLHAFIVYYGWSYSQQNLLLLFCCWKRTDGQNLWSWRGLSSRAFGLDLSDTLAVLGR